MAHDVTSADSSSPVRDVPLPGARAALLVLLTINLFNYIDRQVLAAVVPDIRKAFFATEEDLENNPLVKPLRAILGSSTKPENALIGLLAMAFLVSYMITAPIFGWLAERSRRWLLVGIGVILWSLASGATGVAATFVMLLLTRCFVGVGEAAYGPVAPSMISDLYPVKVRGSVLAWFYMAIPVGSALGYVFGGQVAHLLDWRWAFYLVVPPGLLLGVWSLLMPEPPRGRADLDLDLREAKLRRTEDMPEPSRAGADLDQPQKVRRARVKDYVVFLRTPSFVLDTLGMTAMTFALGGLGFWMPAYIHEVKGVPKDQANTIFGVILVISGLGATILGGIAGDKLRDRYPGSYFLVSGAAMLVGFPISVAMLYMDFPSAWVAVFLACFCLFFNTGPTNTILANVTHPAMRASAYALNILVIHALGDVISPLVIGAITDATGSMRAAFLSVSFMILVGAVLWLWGARYLERDTALAPSRLDA